MSLWTGLAVYFVLWWTVIFAILPFGVRSISDDDVARGHMAGAPRKPRLLFKIVVTSVVAAVIWGVIFLIAESGWVSFRD